MQAERRPTMATLITAARGACIVRLQPSPCRPSGLSVGCSPRDAVSDDRDCRTHRREVVRREHFYGGWTMPRKPFGQGRVALLIGWLAIPGATAGALGAEPVRVRSQAFEIDYRLNEEALPLDTVELWYTTDAGATWQRYGVDEDRQAPMTFHAPAEGLFGFFLVLTNSTGASSAPPSPSTEPQQWAFVDFTPPVVQLHPLRQTTSLGQRVLQVRWTTIDAQLTPRPVEIAYQCVPDESWRPACADPLANTGRYDWRLPDDLIGTVRVRVTVSDRGGNRTHSGVQVVELTPVTPSETVPAGPAKSSPSLATGSEDTTLAGSLRAQERVARLYQEAMDHRSRGEYAEGIARLREVVRLDPQKTEAFAAMAGLLLRMGDSDRALSAYEIALKQQPTMREALLGVAAIYRERKDYESSAGRLRTVLRYNPNDAETWMNLGDVAVFQGDELLARECYTRATRIDPEASEVIADARERLALMAEVSRNFRRDGR